MYMHIHYSYSYLLSYVYTHVLLATVDCAEVTTPL